MLTKTMNREPIAANEDELRALKEFERHVREWDAFELEVGGSDGVRLPLPESSMQILRQVLDELAHDRAVVVTGMPRELSVEQAAQFLNATRAGVQGLLERGLLPSHEMNGQRQVRLDDLIGYRRRREREREEALQRLADQTQEIAPLLE